jgi:hypothetical protein
VLGGIGVVFGAIGVGLGINAAARGGSAERRLAALSAPGGPLQDAQVREIAEFAQEKKRKKKLGGAIGITAGAGAIAAGTLALVAVGVSTFGIGALVLGLGMASVGLGLVIGKWIHRRNKRKAFSAKLDGIAADMLKAARKENPPGPLRAQIADLGVVVADWTDRAAVDGQQAALAAALAQRVDSRRTLMAESLVAYLTGPPTPAMFDAELVLAALHIDAATVRGLIATEGVPTAVARVADKMKSW